MNFKELLKGYTPRGGLLRNEDMYNKHGNIPVYSATTTGPIGFYSKSNYITSDMTILVSLNGVNAGYTSLVPDNKEIWFTSDCGVIELQDWILKRYNREIIAILLQNLFVKNRHINGTQPKFSIIKCLNKDIDLSALDKLKEIDLSDEVNIEESLYKDIIAYYDEIDKLHEKNIIKLEDFINGYVERKKRLVIGRDLYINHGEIKAISSTTAGPMGYYNKSNYNLKDNDFLYAIDGANAGYVSLFKPQPIFITDHAGVIFVKEEYVSKYGKLSIALFLQDYFVKQASTGTQPTFLLKNNLNLKLDLNKLGIISKMKLDNYIK